MKRRTIFNPKLSIFDYILCQSVIQPASQSVTHTHIHTQHIVRARVSLLNTAPHINAIITTHSLSVTATAYSCRLYVVTIITHSCMYVCTCLCLCICMCPYEYFRICMEYNRGIHSKKKVRGYREIVFYYKIFLKLLFFCLLILIFKDFCLNLK